MCVCVFVCLFALTSVFGILCAFNLSVRACWRAGVHAARSRRDQNACVHNFAKIMCDRSAVVVVVDRLSASIRDERGGQRVSTIIDFMCTPSAMSAAACVHASECVACV